MIKLLAAGAVAVTFATPAFADFYIVREGNAGPCRVVESRPSDTKTVIIGNKVYKTRAEADREQIVVCK